MSARWLLLGLSLLASPALADSQDQPLIAHGRALATAGDCVACHTAPGGAPFAGGLSIETPFGVIVSPNITPDPQTGIGAWTDAEFVRAFHEGIGRNGEHLYPAFPYPYYTRVSTADVLAIRAWLNTIAPVRNAVTSNQLPFPFDIRASLIAWNALNFTPGRFVATEGKSDEWNRGAYLVQGLGHCGACHTDKTVLGGDETARALQGGLLAGWYAPNITGDKRIGVGGWSEPQIVSFLKTGHNDFAAATGPMADVVTLSTSQMPDGDLQAIAAYLRDQPAQAPPALPVADQTVMREGGALYVDQCAACHAAKGDGVAGLFPSLAKTPFVQADNPINLIRAVLQGAQSVATDPAPTGAAMPAFGWKLTDGQISALLTFVRASWGNAAAPVTAGDVGAVRKTVPKPMH